MISLTNQINLSNQLGNFKLLRTEYLFFFCSLFSSCTNVLELTECKYRKEEWVFSDAVYNISLLYLYFSKGSNNNTNNKIRNNCFCCVFLLFYLWAMWPGPVYYPCIIVYSDAPFCICFAMFACY